MESSDTRSHIYNQLQKVKEQGPFFVASRGMLDGREVPCLQPLTPVYRITDKDKVLQHGGGGGRGWQEIGELIYHTHPSRDPYVECTTPTDHKLGRMILHSKHSFLGYKSATWVRPDYGQSTTNFVITWHRLEAAHCKGDYFQQIMTAMPRQKAISDGDSDGEMPRLTRISRQTRPAKRVKDNSGEAGSAERVKRKAGCGKWCSRCRYRRRLI